MTTTIDASATPSAAEMELRKEGGHQLSLLLGVYPNNPVTFDLKTAQGLKEAIESDYRPLIGELEAAAGDGANMGNDAEYHKQCTIIIEGIDSATSFSDIRKEIDSFGVPYKVRSRLHERPAQYRTPQLRSIFVEFYNPKMASSVLAAAPQGVILFEGFERSKRRWSAKRSLNVITTKHNTDMVLDPKTGEILAPCMFGTPGSVGGPLQSAESASLARAPAAVSTTATAAAQQHVPTINKVAALDQKSPSGNNSVSAASNAGSTAHSAAPSSSQPGSYYQLQQQRAGQPQQVHYIQQQQQQQQMWDPSQQAFVQGRVLGNGMMMPPMPPNGLMLPGGMMGSVGMYQAVPQQHHHNGMLPPPPPPPPTADFPQSQSYQVQVPTSTHLPPLGQTKDYHTHRPRSNAACFAFALEAHEVAKAYITSDLALVRYYATVKKLTHILDQLETGRMNYTTGSGGHGFVMDYATEVELACMMTYLHLTRGHHAKAVKALRCAVDLGISYGLKYGAHKKKEMQFIMNDLVAALAATVMFETENDMLPHPTSTNETYLRLMNPNPGLFIRSASGDQILRPNNAYQLPFNPFTKAMPYDFATLLFPEATSQLAAHLLLGSLSPVKLFIADE